MKTKKYFIQFLFLLSVFFLLSCASAPEDPVEVTPPTEAPMDDGAMKEAKKMAETARDVAVDVKAPKAAADEFNQARIRFDQAGNAEQQNDYAQAVDLYNQAEKAFLTSADSAKNVRKEAEAAMKLADRVIADSETAADEAISTALGEGEK